MNVCLFCVDWLLSVCLLLIWFVVGVVYLIAVVWIASDVFVLIVLLLACLVIGGWLLLCIV